MRPYKPWTQAASNPPCCLVAWGGNYTIIAPERRDRQHDSARP